MFSATEYDIFLLETSTMSIECCGIHKHCTTCNCIEHNATAQNNNNTTTVNTITSIIHQTPTTTQEYKQPKDTSNHKVQELVGIYRLVSKEEHVRKANLDALDVGGASWGFVSAF